MSVSGVFRFVSGVVLLVSGVVMFVSGVFLFVSGVVLVVSGVCIVGVWLPCPALTTSTLDFQLRNRYYDVLQNVPNISFVLTLR